MKENRKCSVRETVAYYIYACNEMYKNNEKISIRSVIKKIALTIRNVEIEDVLKLIDMKTLKKIPFTWQFSTHEMVSYAFAIFYVLINRKEKLTEETIIKAMMNELYLNKPKKTMKEAEVIAELVFPELKEEND